MTDAMLTSLQRRLPPLEARQRRQAHEAFRFLLSDHKAIDAGRRLARLVTDGLPFDHPAVIAAAGSLRTHIGRLAR